MITMPYSINDFSDKSLSDSLLLIQSLTNDIHREMKKRTDERLVKSIPDYQEELDNSYWAGFETGITWNRNWIPGGPFVLSRDTYCGRTFEQKPTEIQHKIILSQYKHKVWMQGWHDGNSIQLSGKKY